MIEIQNLHPQRRLNLRFFKKLTKEVLKLEGMEEAGVSITFCGDEFIRDLNTKYLGRDWPTDCLSFSQQEGEWGIDDATFLLGDVVISVDRAVEQAKDYNVKPQEELTRLLIHGLLHLFHPKEDESILLNRGEEILKILNPSI